MPNATQLGAFALIITSSFFLLVSKSYPAQTAFFPQAVLSSMLVLSLALAIRSRCAAQFTRPPALRLTKQALAGLAASIVYAASMQYIGYYAASCLFIACLSFFLGCRNISVLLGVSAAFPLLIFILFEIVLTIPVADIAD